MHHSKFTVIFLIQYQFSVEITLLLEFKKATVVILHRDKKYFLNALLKLNVEC